MRQPTASVWMVRVLWGGMLARVHGTKGYCNDYDRSCAAWGELGECDGNNSEWTRKLCPHTCGICALAWCVDKSDACPHWARQGECELSPDYMNRECPTSCGACAPSCVDANEHCREWSSGGQCTENAEFMHLHCPVTCGVCTSTCKDTHDDCPGWARNGECSTNPRYVPRTCPFSCGVRTCFKRPNGQDVVNEVQKRRAVLLSLQEVEGEGEGEGDVGGMEEMHEEVGGVEAAGAEVRRAWRHTRCYDQNASACAVWNLMDQCAQNPVFMTEKCPQTCGACTVVCEDKHLHCREWTVEGACDENSEYMRTACPQACGTCHKIQEFYRTFHDGESSKDEL